MAKQISDGPRVTPAPATPANQFTTRRNAFVWFALLLIALAILRSAISTRLDGFTIDEAYHIAAGVSYGFMAKTRKTRRQKKRFVAPSSSTRRPTSFTFSSEIYT
jgi:hypothetical protein